MSRDVSRGRGSRLVAGLVVAVVACGWFAPVSASAQNGTGVEGVQPPAPDDPGAAVLLDEQGIAASSRAELLGSGWADEDDEAHVVLGSADGLTVLSARSEDGYAWSATAALPVPVADTDLWVSNSCVTSSGDFMAVVYAPRSVTNDEDQFAGGARAAIVDLRTGAVSDLGTGYTISYFNPGCGAGDSVTITRFESGFSTTRVAVVDAGSAAVVRTVDLAGQATSAVSLADGTVLTALGGDVVQVSPGSDTADVVVAGAGSAYDLTVDDQDRLAYVTVDGGVGTSTAYLADLAAPGDADAIATGATSELGVEPARRGGFFLTGSGVAADLAGVEGVQPLAAATPDSVISSTGALVVDSVTPAGMTQTPEVGEPEDSATVEATDPEIIATAVSTAQSLTFALDEAALGATYGGPVAGPEDEAQARGTAPDDSSTAARVGGDMHDPVEAERYCSVPRNDPANQAYQPKPRQVEWAVDRAVKGELTQTRPANWRNLGMPSYSPQGMFKKRTLTGGNGATIPPQIVLGVLAQESNLWQASRFTAPGNTGNPLIGEFYGNREADSIWEIDYEEADCGYGVGQITDGMRMAGHERTDENGNPIETALDYNEQRAIALDYTVNIAKTVQMLGDKWNQLAAAGMLVNGGDPKYIENWFLTTWAYNTGFYPYKNASTPWGVGWFNNPISTVYSPWRLPFLQDQADAAHPQDWPYPEKVTGWAAYGTSLTETQWADSTTRTYKSQLVSSFRTAWWNNDDYRVGAKPPRDLFCDPDVNDCDPTDSEPCQLSSFECWWHGPVAWKDGTNCSVECGQGFERFPSSYATEASAMASTLPALTLQSSYLPNCQNPPAGVVVVDDTTHLDARNTGECAHKSTAGSFQFTFGAPDAQGYYPAKVDLHQQGGGFNGHFSFAHMQDKRDITTHVTGTWNRGADMNGTWTRVWVHLPDYAAWTQQAGYTIDLGDGTTQTRYLPQRRYANEWVSLGVFQMKGSPSVSLSNRLVDDETDMRYDVGDDDPLDIAGYDDIAWDAVGFQALPGKPDDFVVALGDSYGSGEGAGDYAPWSDNNGSLLQAKNACHQSANAWVRKTTLPGEPSTVGAQADSADASMDFHFLACSGAQSEDLMPYYSWDAEEDGGERPPENKIGENGAYPQEGLVSQLDAGYLDENTTLVTLSIGGNDMRFSDIISTCVKAGIYGFPSAECWSKKLSGDTEEVHIASADRVYNELPVSLTTVLEQIRHRAPNAQIAVAGYPKLFETNSACVLVHGQNREWLNNFADAMNQTIKETAEAMNEPGEPDVFYVDTQSRFTGHNLCTADPGINGLQFTVTPGEDPALPWFDFFVNGQVVSRTSVHPNQYGTTLYSLALEDALALHS